MHNLVVSMKCLMPYLTVDISMIVYKSLYVLLLYTSYCNIMLIVHIVLNKNIYISLTIFRKRYKKKGA